MILPLNTIVTILPNRIWPHLAGCTGVIVRVTPLGLCGDAMNGRTRGKRCGQNPIVEVDGGRYLLPASAVMAVDAEGAAA